MIAPQMTTIIFIALMIICGIAMLFCTYKLHRNDKVADFRRKMIYMAGEVSRRRIFEGREDYLAPFDLLDKYSYDDMFNSFKPLKLEAWFTEEEIKILKGESK